MSSGELTPENAVRHYLQYLQDPAQLVDADAIDRLEQEAEKADDLVERLIVLSRLKRARELDEDSYRRDFIAHAHTFANEHEIDVSAFLAMGVSPATLAQAGFPINGGGSRSERPRGGGLVRGDGPRQRAPKVGMNEIQQGILQWRDSFTLADVAGKVGGSPATIRKAIDELVASGRVESLGPDRGHHGKGRAPYRYQCIGN